MTDTPTHTTVRRGQLDARRRHRRRRQDGPARLEQPRQERATRLSTARPRPPAWSASERSAATLTDTDAAVADADVVILAVPDVVLGKVSDRRRPADEARRRSSSRSTRPPPTRACSPRATTSTTRVAHPCHPSVFLERTTQRGVGRHLRWRRRPAGGRSRRSRARRDDAGRGAREAGHPTIYAPVIDVHWVTVKQLAVLEPTLVETIACMIGAFLKEALEETVNSVGVPYEAARAMLSATPGSR